MGPSFLFLIEVFTVTRPSRITGSTTQNGHMPSHHKEDTACLDTAGGCLKKATTTGPNGQQNIGKGEYDGSVWFYFGELLDPIATK